MSVHEKITKMVKNWLIFLFWQQENRQSGQQTHDMMRHVKTLTVPLWLITSDVLNEHLRDSLTFILNFKVPQFTNGRFLERTVLFGHTSVTVVVVSTQNILHSCIVSFKYGTDAILLSLGAEVAESSTQCDTNTLQTQNAAERSSDTLVPSVCDSSWILLLKLTNTETKVQTLIDLKVKLLLINKETARHPVWLLPTDTQTNHTSHYPNPELLHYQGWDRMWEDLSIIFLSNTEYDFT